jgi:glycerophosphoryl diester phosphodiesterase
MARNVRDSSLTETLRFYKLSYTQGKVSWSLRRPLKLRTSPRETPIGGREKMRSYKLAAVLTVILVALAAPAVGAAPQTQSTLEGPVLNIGHRGASAYAPEHTFAAYDLAIAQGADYIEIDLQMTADGVLVAMHDKTLNRTATAPEGVPNRYCRGLISKKTLEQIKKCEVGSWFSPEYADQRIPTLEEIFKQYGTSVNYYIETKNPEAAPGMEEELLSLLKDNGLIPDPSEPANWQVLIQSFSAESLMKIHEMNPDLPLIQLYWAGTSKSIQRDLDAVSAYAVGIGPYKKDVDAALVEAAHEHCLAVHPYTVNTVEEMEDLISLGVDGMFTNNPDLLEGVLGDDALSGEAAAQQASDAYQGCSA